MAPNASSRDFDCFLSHNSHDKPQVRELARHLKTRNLVVWLDEEQLIPGRNWQPLLEQGMEQSETGALLVGKDGIGPWEDEEMQALLYHAVDSGKPVIPVLLPDAPRKMPKLPFFLANRTWVDLRNGFSEQGLDRLTWGITGKRPGSRLASGNDNQTQAEVGYYISHLLGPRSQCPNAETQSLADELAAAYAERDQLMCDGADLKEVQDRILGLVRRLREGGRLSAGDFLLDGRYNLLKVVGSGGFAIVYKAFDQKRRSLVAIKVLHGQHADDKSRKERFFRGARKMNELTHPGIVRVLDPGQTDEGHYFFVMEYLPADDLRKTVLDGQLNPTHALDLILAVGDALAYAHDRDIIHRDIKPANILLDADNRPKLTDFDLVRAGDTTGGTRTGALGTYAYAAPEAMQRAQDADARTDVYGLGMTAIFTLHRADPDPFDIWNDPGRFFMSLGVPEAVQPILQRAIERDIDKRFATIRTFCDALSEARSAKVALRSTEKRMQPFHHQKDVDKAEKQLESGETLTALKQQLTALKSQEDEQEIIRKATSSAGQTFGIPEGRVFKHQAKIDISNWGSPPY